MNPPRSRTHHGRFAALLGVAAIVLTDPVPAETGMLEAVPEPEDFVEGVRLETDGAGPLYEMRVPLRVYRVSEDDFLGDLRVFNAAGEVVAHGLHAPARDRARRRRGEWLPIFPIPGAGAAGDALSLRIRRGGDGRIAEIEAREGETAERRVEAYLVDAGESRSPIESITVDWPPASSPFVQRVEIAASDDLEVWRVVAGASLAHLRHRGKVLRERRLDLPAVTARYLRLRFLAPATVPPLAQAFAERSEPGAAPATEWFPVEPRRDPDRAGRFLFDLPPALPMTRMRITPPNDNVYAEVAVRTRRDAASEWRGAGTVRIYALAYEGGVVRSPAFPFDGSVSRHWAVEVDETSGGFGEGLPSVEVEWAPHVLVFLARGPAPFTLAYGSRRVAPVAESVTQVLASAGGRTGEVDGSFGLPRARAGEVVALGGEEARVAPRAPLDWKRWILWAALVVAAAMLGFIALRLLRDPAPE